MSAQSAEPRRKLAVVLFNLGGPDGPKSVRPFLFNLFSDPAIIAAPAPVRLGVAALISTTRAKSARANYALMGGGSPLLRETQAQADALAGILAVRLPQVDARVFIAMRYWSPLTRETAAEVSAFAPDEVVLLPLYPQFSTTTTGSSARAWAKAYRGPGVTRTVCCYPTLAGLAQAHARRIEATWAQAGRPTPVRLLFSAHGLPERVVAAGDPYRMQIEATCAAVVAALGSGELGPDALGPGGLDWRLCYQSKVGPLKWIGPSTPDAIAEAGRDGTGVLLTPIAFVSEHVETLVELDHEYAELARGLGMTTYLRAPALGVDAGFIAGLADAVEQARAQAEPVATHGGGRFCSADWPKCPARLSPVASPSAL